MLVEELQVWCKVIYLLISSAIVLFFIPKSEDDNDVLHILQEA